MAPILISQQCHPAQREYEDAIARFLSEDPLRFGTGDQNLYPYAGNNPSNGTDPSGRDSLFTYSADSKEVYWSFERSGLLRNESCGKIRIGSKISSTKVLLDARFGGCIVDFETLRNLIESPFGAGLCNVGEQARDRIIKDRLTHQICGPGLPPLGPSPQSVCKAALSGLGTGAKAVVNGTATAIVRTATLGFCDREIELLAVSDEDRAAGFDTAIAIATASGEVLIAAVTGGAADILAKGGQIARTAGGAVVVFDAAGNIIGVVRGAVDVVSSGLTIQNGMQIVGSGLGLAGNSVALRGKTFDIKERGATCPNTSQTCPIPPKELPRGNFPQTSTVVHPSNFLPRNAPEFGGFAHGITPEEIATINRNLGGTTILTGDVTTTLVNASRREGFWNKVATIVRDIAGGHKFNDANKRTAQAVVEELMRRNNICTGVTADEMKKIILRVATGELREVDEIASALRGF